MLNTDKLLLFEITLHVYFSSCQLVPVFIDGIFCYFLFSIKCRYRQIRVRQDLFQFPNIETQNKRSIWHFACDVIKISCYTILFVCHCFFVVISKLVNRLLLTRILTGNSSLLASNKEFPLCKKNNNFIKKYKMWVETLSAIN